MKKIIITTAIAILVIFSMSACKKSDSQTTLQKIQAKWQLDNYYENDHFSGVDHFKTITGTSADYYDFRTDGKVYFSFGGYSDISTYSLISDTKLLIDGTDNYDIKTLTTNSFIIYGKDAAANGDFLEATYTFKK